MGKIKEHFKAPSPIHLHSTTTGHPMDPDQFSVVHKESQHAIKDHQGSHVYPHSGPPSKQELGQVPSTAYMGPTPTRTFPNIPTQANITTSTCNQHIAPLLVNPPFPHTPPHWQLGWGASTFLNFLMVSKCIHSKTPPSPYLQ